MLIDSFLFFQELDLLEIRLEYLSPYIDKFIIVESCQTFKGEKKAYNFEINKKRFEKYINKIIYYKIDSFFELYVGGYLLVKSNFIFTSAPWAFAIPSVISLILFST